VRATKEADHDVAAFGNAVIEVRLAPSRRSLLYRCHHLRDCAWSENAAGAIDTLHRNFKPTARQLMQLSPKTAPPSVRQAAATDRERRFPCRQAVVPAATYAYPFRAVGAEMEPVEVFWRICRPSRRDRLCGPFPGGRSPSAGFVGNHHCGVSIHVESCRLGV
jgi:hypothetical protein